LAWPVLDKARDVLDHHDRIIDEEADGDGQRHQREIVEAVAEHGITAKVSISETVRQPPE
jgi:hypothetical protein